ncbi:PLP-dependent aminotransferase family protein [Stenotrophomonas sp. Iso1]|uniref:aminotransferase-like domain-containing protein n=1 Tax=Stenotrophomonas sp. Iso1 TaxID=2977283 RepID=UPI0022B7BE5F|nr:PLP-dependent aminotransferase family protein [Stenotrophomonas sp. Iso1]
MALTSHPISLAEKVATDIGRQILAGVLKAGDKLPSLREYARLNGYSKNTVIAAFDLLSERAMVHAQHGKGFFVRGMDAQVEREDDDEPVGYGRAIDTIWLMRQQALRDPGSSNLGEGFPPVEWLMDMRLDRFHRQITRSGVGSLFRYGNRYGYLPLRQHLVRRLAGYGIEAGPRQLVTTFGANHALDLVTRCHVRPGDSVLVEDPGYYPLFGKLRMHGAIPIAIPRLVDGPDLVALEVAIQQTKARVFFMQSAGHNPTGTDISDAVAQRLVQLAQKYDLLIVENDSLADFKGNSTPRVSALTQLKNTIYIGSFSKSISAALRIGFIAAESARAEELADVKMLLHFGGSEYSERVLEAILREGNFLRHIKRLQDRLRVATQAGLESLRQFDATVYATPEQSLYLWARFPGVTDTRLLTIRMLARGVVLAPGAFFHLNTERISPWTRLNVAYLSDPLFVSSLRQELDQASSHAVSPLRTGLFTPPEWAT